MFTTVQEVRVQKMNKYQYEVYEVSDINFQRLHIGDKYKGGVVAEGIGGLANEHLLIVAYEIVENEDEQEPA